MQLRATLNVSLLKSLQNDMMSLVIYRNLENINRLRIFLVEQFDKK